MTSPHGHSDLSDVSEDIDFSDAVAREVSAEVAAGVTSVAGLVSGVAGTGVPVPPSGLPAILSPGGEGLISPVPVPAGTGPLSADADARPSSVTVGCDQTDAGYFRESPAGISVAAPAVTDSGLSAIAQQMAAFMTEMRSGLPTLVEQAVASRLSTSPNFREPLPSGLHTVSLGSLVSSPPGFDSRVTPDQSVRTIRCSKKKRSESATTSTAAAIDSASAESISQVSDSVKVENSKPDLDKASKRHLIIRILENRTPPLMVFTERIHHGKTMRLCTMADYNQWLARQIPVHISERSGFRSRLEIAQPLKLSTLSHAQRPKKPDSDERFPIEELIYPVSLFDPDYELSPEGKVTLVVRPSADNMDRGSSASDEADSDPDTVRNRQPTLAERGGKGKPSVNLSNQTKRQRSSSEEPVVKRLKLPGRDSASRERRRGTAGPGSPPPPVKAEPLPGTSGQDTGVPVTHLDGVWDITLPLDIVRLNGAEFFVTNTSDLVPYARVSQDGRELGEVEAIMVNRLHLWQLDRPVELANKLRQLGHVEGDDMSYTLALRRLMPVDPPGDSSSDEEESDEDFPMDTGISRAESAAIHSIVQMGPPTHVSKKGGPDRGRDRSRSIESRTSAKPSGEFPHSRGRLGARAEVPLNDPAAVNISLCPAPASLSDPVTGRRVATPGPVYAQTDAYGRPMFVQPQPLQVSARVETDMSVTLNQDAVDEFVASDDDDSNSGEFERQEPSTRDTEARGKVRQASMLRLAKLDSSDMELMSHVGSGQFQPVDTLGWGVGSRANSGTTTNVLKFKTQDSIRAAVRNSELELRSFREGEGKSVPHKRQACFEPQPTEASLPTLNPCLKKGHVINRLPSQREQTFPLGKASWPFQDISVPSAEDAVVVGADPDKIPRLTGVSFSQPQWEHTEATTSAALKSMNNVSALFQRLLKHTCDGNTKAGESGPVRVRGSTPEPVDEYLPMLIKGLSHELNQVVQLLADLRTSQVAMSRDNFLTNGNLFEKFRRSFRCLPLARDSLFQPWLAHARSRLDILDVTRSGASSYQYNKRSGSGKRGGSVGQPSKRGSFGGPRPGGQAAQPNSSNAVLDAVAVMRQAGKRKFNRSRPTRGNKNHAPRGGKSGGPGRSAHNAKRRPSAKPDSKPNQGV